MTTHTFLYTDIEGSTRLLEQHPEAIEAALARCDRLLHQAIDASGGRVFSSTGDSLAAVFTLAPDALAAALACQRALTCPYLAEGRGKGGTRRARRDPEIRVRIAIHTGEAVERDGNYIGAAPNATARLVRAAHGGQVLLSLASRALVGEHLPEDATLRDLGEHRLKDLSRPMRIFQLVPLELPADFPPLRTIEWLESGRRLRSISLELLSLLDRAAILSQLTRELPAVLPAPEATLFLLDPADGIYRQTDPALEPVTLSPRESLLLHRLKELGRPVVTDELDRPDSDPSLTASDREIARRLGAALWVPLRPWGRLLGALALGRKLTDEPYTEEELDALCLIANEAAVALENAALSEEREKQARLQQELAIARTIQMSLLPPPSLCVHGYEVLSRSEPSAEVGGDFYNLFPVGDREVGSGEPSIGVTSPPPTRLGVLLGDVAGKGVPAALFMAVTTTLIQGQARLLPSPAETLAAANGELYPKMRGAADGQPLFATAIYGVLDTSLGEVRLASAGQTPPIYWPASGTPRYIRLCGVPLGALPGSVYQEATLRLAPGDRLLLCTDGFIEGPDADGGQVGYAGFLRRLAVLGDRSSADLVSALFDALRAEATSPFERDDRTLVLITARTS